MQTRSVRVDISHQTLYMMGSTQAKFNLRTAMTKSTNTNEMSQPRPPLSDAARRALAEAEARRIEAVEREATLPKEVGGRGGHDPARYGDWEVKGMACDF